MGEVGLSPEMATTSAARIPRAVRPSPERLAEWLVTLQKLPGAANGGLPRWRISSFEVAGAKK